MNRQDADSSCHRLSRIPQKYAPNRAIRNEKQYLFAVAYFEPNPESTFGSGSDRPAREAVGRRSDRFSCVQQKAVHGILFS